MDTEEIPQNKDPEIIGAVFQTALGFIELYGWIIVFVIIAVLYLRSKVQPWLYKRSQQSDINDYKKMDTGAVQAKLEAMERARLKMQAKHDQEAKIFAERQKQREAEKRIQRLDLDRQKGKGPGSQTRKAPADLPSTSSRSSQPKKSLKPAYNPLMGDNGGACFRPPRRGGASGGG